MIILLISERDRRRLYQALVLAEDYQASSIDSCRVGSGRSMRGLTSLVVPKEHRTQVAQWRRDIAAFGRLRARLQDLRKAGT